MSRPWIALTCLAAPVSWSCVSGGAAHAPIAEPADAGDYATPFQCLQTINDALKTRDPQRIARSFVTPAGAENARMASALLDRPETFAPLPAAQMRFRDAIPIDASTIERRLAGVSESLTAAQHVYVLLDYGPEAEPRTLAARFPCALQGRKWRLCPPTGFMHEVGPWDLSTPKAALMTLCWSIHIADVVGVYELLAAPSVDRSVFRTVVRSRLAALPPPVPLKRAATHTQVVQQRRRHSTRRRVLDQRLIQFEFRRAQPEDDRIYVNYDPKHLTRARVWSLSAESQIDKRLDYESFRREGEEWRWIPKTHYIWHVTPDDPDLKQVVDQTR